MQSCSIYIVVFDVYIFLTTQRWGRLFRRASAVLISTWSDLRQPHPFCTSSLKIRFSVSFYQSFRVLLVCVHLDEIPSSHALDCAGKLGPCRSCFHVGRCDFV